MTDPFKKVKSKLRNWSQVRFKEPIVIFESDDWGMWRSPENKSKLESFGEPKIWGYDQLESASELDAFFTIFEKYSDSESKKPFAEANFVVSNPDFNATIEKKYSEIVLKPIHTDRILTQKWMEGIKKEVFLPQYHGRFHFNFHKMLNSLQNDQSSRDIFEARIHGGINNYKEGKWGLHSEYLNWDSGIIPDNLDEWLLSGINEFENTFGYRPLSTIAPQYIFSPSTAALFKKLNFKCIQGTNMQMFKTADGKEMKRNLPNGSGYYGGLIAIGRNVKFEPTRGVPQWNTESAIKAAWKNIYNNIPVIIDSHRINYVGRFAEEGIAQLDIFLEKLCKMGVRFMASFELAEAIVNDGNYKSFFTGKNNKLQLLEETSYKKWVRDHIV